MSEQVQNTTEQPPSKRGSLDWSLAGGIGVGFLCVIIGMYLEGTTIMAYVMLAPAVIVFGGTFGATAATAGTEATKACWATFKRALFFTRTDRISIIRSLTGFAEKARREGLLLLEDELQNIDDPFMKKGVQLVVDGTDPELVKEILETEIDALAELNTRDAHFWNAAGGYSPTLGIIGTVMGLVNVLANLSDAAALGPAISVAFVATFYGVAFANLVFLPLGGKLKLVSDDEVAARELMVEGILSIQSGDNPRIVMEKLKAFLPPAERLALDETGDERGPASAAAQAA